MTAPHGVMILLADMNAMEARHWAFVGWRHCQSEPQCVTTPERANRPATHWQHLPTFPSVAADSPVLETPTQGDGSNSTDKENA